MGSGGSVGAVSGGPNGTESSANKLSIEPELFFRDKLGRLSNWVDIGGLVWLVEDLLIGPGVSQEGRALGAGFEDS